MEESCHPKAVMMCLDNEKQACPEEPQWKEFCFLHLFAFAVLFICFLFIYLSFLL